MTHEDYKKGRTHCSGCGAARVLICKCEFNSFRNDDNNCGDRE